MPLAEVQPRAEVAPGTYEAVVSNVEPDIIVPKTGRNAGQNVPILRWNFAIEGVEDRIESITGRDPTSEKSNLFKYFVATLGSDKTKWLDAETEDLVGKPVLVTISISEDGWPRVDNVTARPTRRGAVPVAATITVAEEKTEAQPEPVIRDSGDPEAIKVVSPLRDEDDELPF